MSLADTQAQIDSWINNPTGMDGIPTPITSIRPNNGTSTSTPSNSAATPSSGLSALPSLSDIWSAIQNGAGGTVAAAGANAVAGANSVATDPLGTAAKVTSAVGGSVASWLPRAVFIVLGLLLVAAGIFSFKSGQTIITEFGKGVRDGALAA